MNIDVLLNAYTGPGTDITDEFICAQLAFIEGRTKQDTNLVGSMVDSNSLHHLVRSWCNQRYGMTCKAEESKFHDEMVSDWPADGIPLARFLQMFWFVGFETTVIAALQRISMLESKRFSNGHAECSPIDSLKQAMSEELARYNPGTVQAVLKLREAAQLLGMPADYYISRKDTGSDCAAVGEGHKGAGHTRCLGVRPPRIESYPERLVVHDAYRGERDALAAVAAIYNDYDADLQHVGKRGKQAFERWAIRKLWAAIRDAFNQIGSLPKIHNPWSTMCAVLALCGVHVDSETVGKTVKAIDGYSEPLTA